MNSVYMGWDSREQLAYDVAERSILRRSQDVSVIPLKLREPPVSDVMTRPVETRDGKLWCPISQAPMATEFAISRFSVPFLHKTGFALFVDCDILCRTDINELFRLADSRYAVQVVKNVHQPVAQTKMDGQPQTTYPRKNWSSVVLWNCSHPSNKSLTLEKLNTWPGRDLHAFLWLEDHEIGGLPCAWNHLVGVSTPSLHEPKILHYTNGGPWLNGWTPCPMDEIWTEERKASGL